MRLYWRLAETGVVLLTLTSIAAGNSKPTTQQSSRSTESYGTGESAGARDPGTVTRPS
jgi:hypothetical protein